LDQPPHQTTLHVRERVQSQRSLFTFHVESVEALPVKWSLIAGDVLTNFRAALDYLAHDLVGAGHEPHWKGGTKPQFAIGSYKEVFRKKVRVRMPAIQLRHRTSIEKYQPYKWRSARSRHPLAVLEAFVVRDKRSLSLSLPTTLVPLVAMFSPLTIS
jgi:hypothetical protein